MKLAAVLSLVPALAFAHGADHPRRIDVALAPEGAAIVFTLELDANEGDSIRRLFDRDRDGRLSREEEALVRDYLSRRALGGFELRGLAKPLSCRSSEAELRGAADSKKPIGLRLRCAAAWKLPISLEIFDGGDREGHVPITFAGDAVQVESALGKTRDGALDLPAREATKLRVTKR